MLRLLDIPLYLLNLVIGPLRVVARDTDELQLRKSLHILQRDLPTKLTSKGHQAIIHSLIGRLTCAATLNQLIELILDEDAL